MTEVFYILEGEVELIFDDETIVTKAEKMRTIFKNGQFDLYLKRLSKMSDADFANKKLMQSISVEFDIYES